MPEQKHSDVASMQRVQTACLMILAFVTSGLAMWMLRPVLVPFVLAVFFVYCLAPLIDVQTRRLRMPTWLAIVFAGVLGLLLLIAAGYVVAVAIGRMSADLPKYQEQLNQLGKRLSQDLPLEKWGLGGNGKSPFAMPESTVQDFMAAVVKELTGLVSNGILVIIIMIFILMGYQKRRVKPGSLVDEIETKVKLYITQMVLFSLVTGLLVGITLWALGVPFALGFAVLVFFLNFVPNIGAILSTLLPLPVILLDPNMGIVAKVLAIAIPTVLQFVIGNIIQPKVQGDTFQLHPVVVLLALIFFGMIWGLVGAFLATPITAVIKIVLERIPATRVVGRLLAGDLTALDGQPAP